MLIFIQLVVGEGLRLIVVRIWILASVQDDVLWELWCSMNGRTFLPSLRD